MGATVTAEVGLFASALEHSSSSCHTLNVHAMRTHPGSVGCSICSVSSSGTSSAARGTAGLVLSSAAAVSLLVVLLSDSLGFACCCSGRGVRPASNSTASSCDVNSCCRHRKWEMREVVMRDGERAGRDVTVLGRGHHVLDRPDFGGVSRWGDVCGQDD